MSTTDSLTLIGTIVIVIVPLAGLIWYIINHRSEWKKILLAGVFTVLLMAALLTGVNTAASQLSKSTPSLTPSGANLTSTAVNRTSPTNQPPTATSTQQIIQINQTSRCTNCFNTDLSLIVKNATIDPANSQVTLLIGFRNNSTTTISPYMNSLKLQDTQTGVSVNGGGDGFGNIFPITPNQTVLFRPTFQFVPVAGHEYSLSAELSSQYDFSPITIKF